MFLTTTISDFGEKSGVEVSYDGKCMLIDLSGKEGIKIFSGLDDDDGVTEGRSRGILKNGASVVEGYSVGVYIEAYVIDTNVEVKSSYS